MKSMCKHWGLHISTNINCLEVVLGSFWAVWRGLLLSLEPKLRFWQFPRYWWFNKRYHGGYQFICLISWPLLIASKRDWYRSKGLLKGFKLALRPWKSSKNWWRYDQMKFVTLVTKNYVHNLGNLSCLVRGAINIKDWDVMWEGPSVHPFWTDKISVNKASSRSAVQEGLDGVEFTCVRGSNFYWQE